VKEARLPESLHKLLSSRNHGELGIIATGAGIALALLWYMVRLLRRVSPAEMERRRRTALASMGRIIDGVIVDAPLYHQDEVAEGAAALIAFKYRIAGVVYECTQDVTTLQTEIEDFRIDLPVSIKYDPRNPANSIVVAESWSGLRTGAETPRFTGRGGTTSTSM
jgi:hypothetical protein